MASLALYWSVMIACYLLASRLRRYADRRYRCAVIHAFGQAQCLCSGVIMVCQGACHALHAHIINACVVHHLLCHLRPR